MVCTSVVRNPVVVDDGAHPTSPVRHRCEPPMDAILQEYGDPADCVLQEGGRGGIATHGEPRDPHGGDQLAVPVEQNSRAAMRAATPSARSSWRWSSKTQSWHRRINR